ncbi:GAF domain-containing protein [Marivita sp.]|uniref:GAF domain-containing protein n=1 Tax=Marivita sp. TaxID=2003365 RepID=UPI0025BBFFC4|nr:GAF domain-containing protein [Marivita sp.]
MSNTALARFDLALAQAETPDHAYKALNDLVDDTVGAKLFTIMSVNMDAMLARRAYSSDAANYPTSGTKEITINRWFDHVHGKGQTFVANTLNEIDTVFPDAELIGRLGCGSVINLPVTQDGHLVATMNILHEEQYYTAARVSYCNEHLSDPAHRAVQAARRLGS